MNFEFILDENYLALFILQKKMFNETKSIENIKKIDTSNIKIYEFINFCVDEYLNYQNKS